MIAPAYGCISDMWGGAGGGGGGRDGKPRELLILLEIINVRLERVRNHKCDEKCRYIRGAIGDPHRTHGTQRGFTPVKV